MEKIVRKVQQTLIDRLLVARQFSQAMHMDQTKEHIRRLYKKSDVGRKLVKAGVALIAVPDPITDIPGAAIAVSGAIIDRYKSSIAITQLNQEIRKIVSNLPAV